LLKKVIFIYEGLYTRRLQLQGLL